MADTTSGEPDFATSIAAVIKEESAGGAACGWRSCTGCHETNEGAETGYYPYSKMFGCYVGGGCSECGGLGVVWEHWSEEALKAMAADVSTPPAERVVEAQIEHMVQRFLQWKLPENFNPDGGIGFDKSYRSPHGPVGTNLFDATQAEAMVRHMLEGLPALAAKDGRS